ncbi:MAG: VOC family protein [Chthoniobacterales bacterium]|nr:VOC family protein [Chthoniobacterales bacterium]
MQCGWLTDKFGLFWQVVPTKIPSGRASQRGMHAVMDMKKFDLATLQRAFDGK